MAAEAPVEPPPDANDDATTDVDTEDLDLSTSMETSTALQTAVAKAAAALPTPGTGSSSENWDDTPTDSPSMSSSSDAATFNLRFYRNQIRCEPDNLLIDDFHRTMCTDFESLEWNHGYIQWLFPLFEGKGLNYRAHALEKDEARTMREDKQVAIRFIRSYRMMLAFYGIVLRDPVTGALRRNSDTYKERYHHFQHSTHNYLRMTRILKALGHLGFTRYKIAFSDFLGQEIEAGRLKHCKTTYKMYWSTTLDVDSRKFISETGETAADRTDSILLQELQNNQMTPEEFMQMTVPLQD